MSSKDKVVVCKLSAARIKTCFDFCHRIGMDRHGIGIIGNHELVMELYIERL
jgi:hypothetical protein